jgi:hypothetical protein
VSNTYVAVLYCVLTWATAVGQPQQVVGQA